MIDRASRNSGEPSGLRVSFEFFPPKTEAMEETLWQSIERLAPLAPDFVSVTYGAGGSTRERTHATVARILAETALKPAAHLTCVGATRAEVDAVVDGYAEAGVRHIVALRGDPVEGIGTVYRPHPGGYDYAADLVGAIRKRHPEIEVSVSAYAERHPESPDWTDRDRQSEAQGRCRREPRDHAVLLRQRPLFGLPRPRRGGRHLDPDRAGHRSGAQFLPRRRNSRRRPARACRTGSRRASRGWRRTRRRASWWRRRSVPNRCSTWSIAASADFHFYTMNRADLVYAVCHLLGMRPETEPAKETVAAA